MTKIRINTQREKWLAKNKTNKIISIGDLPSVPTFAPGQQHDLLQFAKKEKINESSDLIRLVKVKWIKLNKQVDKIDHQIEKSEAADSVTSVEMNELEDLRNDFETDLTDYYTKDETDTVIDDATVTPVTEGDTVDENTKGAVIYGTDTENTAQPIGITGAESDALEIISIDEEDILDKILNELSKLNIQMSILTDNYVQNKDIKDFDL